jgi:hypothetical protein
LDIESVGVGEARVICDFKNARPVHTYRLEAQTVGLDAHGRPEAKWAPFARATMEVNGSSVSAELKHLQPNALYVVRLLGLDAQGAVVAVSSAGELWTARAADGGHWGWVMLGGAALVVGVWGWRKWRGMRLMG